jgi:ferredoxin
MKKVQGFLAKPKSATIFYFSGTGNTWWIADLIKKEFDANNIPTMAFSIESPTLQNRDYLEKIILDSELLILGYPIHGSDMPCLMKEFINVLPNLTDYKTVPHYMLIYCTQYMCSGDGAYFYRKKIENKGYCVPWTLHFRMPNNISVPKSPFQYTNDPEKIEKYLKRAQIKIKKALNLIQEGITIQNGKTILGKLIGGLQRHFYQRELHHYNQKWSIIPTRCTLCQRCVKICATKNISFDQGKIAFADQCILCLRCYNYCPTAAIQFGKNFVSPDKTPYRGPIHGFRPEILKK